MARSIKRASQATVDTVHRLVGKELARQLRVAATDKTEGVSAALLGQAIAFLKLTDTTNPEKSRPKVDKLAEQMVDFDKENRKWHEQYGGGLPSGTPRPTATEVLAARAAQVPSGDPYANLGSARE